MMGYKRKYKKGEKIKSLDELISQEFVYFYDKITSVGWFGSWQLRWAKSMLDNGKLFKAVPIGNGGSNDQI